MHLKTNCRWIAATAVLCACCAAWAQTTDSTIERGRQVFARHKGAVVTVQLVIKQQFAMEGRSTQENEERSEATGTVIDPMGLTVMALSAIDPSRLYRDMMAAQGMQDTDFKMESEVSSVKILLEDGAELNARVILRDSDLDLAFLRPTEKPGEPLSYVDLTDAAQPEMLDDLLALNRLGKVARRAYSASFERVEAIVTKPRTFYIPGQRDAGNATLGCPAFSLDGKIVGIAVLRASAAQGTNIRDNMLVILVPAADILEAAQQVPAFEETEGAQEETNAESK